MVTPKVSVYQPWQVLREGDIIDVIAPASPRLKNEASITAIKELLVSWNLVPRIPDDIFGIDLLCANTDAKRFDFLKAALLNTESRAVWCLRGGYGSGRLIPQLANLEVKNPVPKLFIGMSDITALHLFLQRHFHWVTLHGPSVRQVTDNDVAKENIEELKQIMFGRQNVLRYNNLTPLNKQGLKNQLIETCIVGGNFCLIQASIGTLWQVDARNKILFLEEINERGYRVDRMLQHLEQAGIFKDVTAVIFGDFTGGQEPNGTCLIDPVLKRFAESCDFPVLRCPGIGHGKFNRVLPLGTNTQLQLGETASMIVNAGFTHD